MDSHDKIICRPGYQLQGVSVHGVMSYRSACATCASYDVWIPGPSADRLEGPVEESKWRVPKCRSFDDHAKP